MQGRGKEMWRYENDLYIFIYYYQCLICRPFHRERLCTISEGSPFKLKFFALNCVTYSLTFSCGWGQTGWQIFSMYGCSILFLHLLLPCVSVGVAAAAEWHTWFRSTHHTPALSTWSLHHFSARLSCSRRWQHNADISVFLKRSFSYFWVFWLFSNSLVCVGSSRTLQCCSALLPACMHPIVPPRWLQLTLLALPACLHTWFFHPHYPPVPVGASLRWESPKWLLRFFWCIN